MIIKVEDKRVLSVEAQRRVRLCEFVYLRSDGWDAWQRVCFLVMHVNSLGWWKSR